MREVPMNGLAVRVMRGWFFFQVFLALILFTSAGTLDYRAGWIYWVLFGFATASISLYFLRYDPALVKRRMSVGPLAEKRPFQKIIQAATSLTLCAIYVVAGLDFRFGRSTVPPALVAGGDILLLLSYLLMFFVFRQNGFASATVEVQPEQRVIRTGLYGMVRHPMYASAVLMFGGTALALESYWALLPAAAVVGMMVARLLDEEHYLRANLAGYDEYCRQVRYRLLPSVW
jgi:protein-S-isoprenylcysteine O-methyltransferase Ste14